MLCIAQKRLRDLKGRISAQSKKNFVLERDVRYLDSRIALLIQNRMALDEVSILLAENTRRPNLAFIAKRSRTPFGGGRSVGGPLSG